MKTEEIALSRVVENEENPRTITTEKFQKLVKSLLVFPRMLTLRPIVVDETMTVLGGNMRLRALKHIVSMDWDTLRFTISDGEKFTQGEVDALLKYWEGWRKKPVATIVNATDLTEAQKKEFIIKDNVGFGDWDTDMLNNGWNTDLLKDWGIESWKLQGWGGTSNATSGGSSQQEPDETESSMGDTPDELPIELQGKDLTPDDLPKIEGDDKTAMERIIITFKSEERDYLAALLGLASIDKVLYSVDELKDKNGSEN